MDTKERILDAAERLFAGQGYAATSLRHITGDAGVNLAAVHYHFGSKEELLQAVIMRRAGPVNEERLALLKACERKARNGKPAADRVIDAFIAPTFHVVLQPGGETFVRLMGRIHGEGDIVPRIVRTAFGQVLRRFADALGRALPHLPAEELDRRMHFAIGSMAHALLEQCSGQDPETLRRSLVAFLSAGMRAPLASGRSK